MAEEKALIPIAEGWFEDQGWKPFQFQRESWHAYLSGYNGLVNAPTGSGKTYSLVMPILLEYIRENGGATSSVGKNGLRAIWITPIKALAKEISNSAQRAVAGLGLDWQVSLRTGDTSPADRQKMKKNPPEFLITTPESLQLMLAQKGYPKFFKNLRAVVCDEWHELMGSKRGVQMELGLSRLKTICPKLKIWGISATIGNMDEAVQALLGASLDKGKSKIIRSDIKKVIEVESVLPDTLEKLPWAGHLGVNLIDKVIPIIKNSNSTLIFTNTRSFAEIWYQKLLDRAPELAGTMAMHHGSISRELRDWVEDALHNEQLKAVVCTSSLDLGVDFRPVETIIQIGSPKGVARFMQRAGRSGHQPGALSKIYFVPTHSLELVEAAALREAIKVGLVEDRIPFIRSFDVLIQYLVTLAVSDGFDEREIFEEVKETFCYNSIDRDEWLWLLSFITTGGSSLTAYDEYRKVEIEDGLYKVTNRRIAMRHRLSIGTIVSDSSLKVKYITGKYIGTIEEWFIARLSPGDVFWFAGRNLEFVRIKEMVVQVRNTKKKAKAVPSWMGGRMPLSSQMSVMLRKKLHGVTLKGKKTDPELNFLMPLMELQRKRSHLPNKDEFLIEYFKSKEGYHVLMYPFEGRFVHEGMGALLAKRISEITPITLSIAMNDYGFELLSDREIPIYEALETDVLTSDNLYQDIQGSMNSVEMARRRFRDIASISGLVFKGYPGQQIKDRHLQSSSQLFFDVFHDYEADNLLLLQAYEEVMDFQLEEARMRRALERIHQQKIIVTEPEKPTPFAFPIMVDRMREKLSSEKLEDRIRRMTLDFEE
ncbi:ligase-associated DNA damage response DEXH box helicase [Fulvivirga sediminis]|uniref:Ligase-associated DNA damage response DEXH box helicase n=1 Tax=Fulvivirga sediminis TaxID=2803949 RepID=A0A937F7Z7_9BACT|nr:ligase-associated DNA damage response DEXH box helicase [Fulvivirga sediminis]MBL3657996.1 ligase-associated DNA damage response DEXH box helicase [Fulvivirga sediminis]